MKTVRCGNIDLNVLDEGTGEVLLLVHGFPLDHTMWREQIAAFSTSRRVIAPDLRGFGSSAATAGTATMEGFADDLAALLDALRVRGKVAFCGLSMGGYVAWQFWRRHAQRLDRLILCDTRAVADSADAAKERLETADKVLREGAGVVAESMLPKLFAAATRDRRPEVVEATRQVILAAPPQGIAAALRGMAARPDVTAWLPKIDMPSLVVVGAEDKISTVDEMREIADSLPAARLVVVPQAAHLAPLENPAVVNAALMEFLAR